MESVSFFLVFLAILLVGAVLWASAGSGLGLFRRGPHSAGTADPGGAASEPGVPRAGNRGAGLLEGGFEQPPANLPPVLLPAVAVPADIDRVRFSLGLRGYRMDQVDQVLDELRDQLAAKDEEVRKLRARLPEAERTASPETDA